MRVARLTVEDAARAAMVHRASFDERLPWLAGLHTPEEDLHYFREHVFASCVVAGALEADRIAGVIAYREGWIDQLYVLPDMQGRGIGSLLLDVARSSHDDLSLWTFQRNSGARSFYERKGFRIVKETDGSENEEKEPDALYRWIRPGALD